MFDAFDVQPATGSRFQSAGVSERVTITEVVLIENNGIESLQLKTTNEKDQSGQSKRLSLKTEVSPGKTISAWKVSAKYLQNILISATGMSVEDSQKVLSASNVDELKRKLEKVLLGKTVRGLFSSREYQTGKFAIELYTTEPIKGTTLVWDPNNRFYNSKLPVEETEKTSNFPF